MILLRYAIVAGGSAWWLVAELSRSPSQTDSAVLPILLVASIVFNVVLDILERGSRPPRLVKALLRHQLLYDCLVLNIFFAGASGSFLIGTPVHAGGARVLPVDVSILVSSGFVALASGLLQNSLFVVYLLTCLLSLTASQVVSVAQELNVPVLEALNLVDWGHVLEATLLVLMISILSYTATEHARRRLQDADTRILDVSRDKERMQASFHKLSFLTAIVRDMSSSQAFEQVLETITDRAALFFGADDALVATIDADLEHLSVVAAKSEYRDALSALRIKRGEGILGKVFDSDAPELIKNALLDPRAVQIYGTPEEPESMLVAPLRKRSQKYGIVSVSRIGLENPFTEDDLALFTSFANIAASVLDNATILEALKRKNFTLAVTNQLSSAIASPLPFDEEIQSFLTIIKESFRLSRIDLMLVESDRFTRFYSVPLQHEATPALETIAELNAGNGVVGQAMRDHALVNVPDVSKHPSYIGIDPATRSELAIPLKSTDGRVSAVLNLESAQEEYFSHDIATDARTIASEVQEFLQGRLIWEEVKDQRNIREAINRAELENIAVSTLEETATHLSRLLARVLPHHTALVLLENSGDAIRPWKAVYVPGGDDLSFARNIETETAARLETSHSLAHTVTSLMQGHDLLVRQLDFEQHLVGFVLVAAGDRRPLTSIEASAFDLFMAYAESIVQKMFLKQRTTLLTRYRAAAKELIDASFKRADVHQFLAATARKLKEAIGADAAAFIPYDPETHRLNVAQAEVNGFQPDPTAEPTILVEALSNPDLSILHAEMKNGTTFAPGCTVEISLRMILEGSLYGVLYAAFDHAVIISDEERRLVETFVSDCTLVAENILYVHRIDELSITDELTGLGNYRSWVTHISEQSERTARFGEIFSLLFFDIDDFKRYNDTFSHLDGNIALQGIADIMRHGIRSVDSAYRYGGEEFVILMPGAPSTDARKAAERIRAAVERNSARDHQRFRSPLTVSGGIASFEDRVVDQKSLLLLADLAMYQAKKNGKNTVYVLESLTAIGQTRPSSGKKG